MLLKSCIVKNFSYCKKLFFYNRLFKECNSCLLTLKLYSTIPKATCNIGKLNKKNSVVVKSKIVA